MQYDYTLKKPHGYWTEQRIREESSKYTSLGDFERGCKGAYLAGKRKKLLRTLFESKHRTWTLESLKDVALQYKSKHYFNVGDTSAYQIFRKKYPKEFYDLFGKKSVRVKPYKWSIEDITKEAAKYSSKKQFVTGSQAAHDACLRYKGLLDSLFVNIKRSAYSKEEIIEIAKKYSTKAEFQANHPSAYVSCIKRFKGLIDELFENQNKPDGFWTKDNIIKEASLYKSKNELRMCCGSAYTIAIKCYPGLLDQIYGDGFKNGTRDKLYIWQDDASDIYKIGITSSHMGEVRIKSVAKKGGFDCVNIIRCVKVSSPIKLEKNLLKYGSKVFFSNKFDGYSEFRRLTNDELRVVVSIIDKETIFDFE